MVDWSPILHVSISTYFSVLGRALVDVGVGVAHGTIRGYRVRAIDLDSMNIEATLAPSDSREGVARVGMNFCVDHVLALAQCGVKFYPTLEPLGDEWEDDGGGRDIPSRDWCMCERCW